jgi:hypothetical protein
MSYLIKIMNLPSGRSSPNMLRLLLYLVQYSSGCIPQPGAQRRSILGLVVVVVHPLWWHCVVVHRPHHPCGKTLKASLAPKLRKPHPCSIHDIHEGIRSKYAPHSLGSRQKSRGVFFWLVCDGRCGMEQERLWPCS